MFLILLLLVLYMTSRSFGMWIALRLALVFFLLGTLKALIS